MNKWILSISLMFLSLASFGISTLEEYNQQLPYWGVSWEEGAQSVNGYYPSFYTGFVMRSESPQRIHIRTARGNSTRVSVILDDQTINDYLFDLVKRDEFYKKATSGNQAKLNLRPSGSDFLPQQSFFSQIIQSSQYGIQSFVQSAKSGSVNTETIYAKSLQVLRQLNPGRVFMLNLDLKVEFARWNQSMRSQVTGNLDQQLKDSKFVISAINQLVFGRINYTGKPTSEIINKLKNAIELGLNNASDDKFIPAALDLFKAVTENKYSFSVLNSSGNFQAALQCSPNSCVLSYPEFTTIYPTGSVQESTTDDFGNTINSYATPGLWNFIARPGKHDVDNIRDEPYYGFIPKMDFEGIGNGFHNPAVRFWEPSAAVRNGLGISAKHSTLWTVKRGPVSHGCLRLPSGHVWELRHIMPVESSKMEQVFFFGNRSADFDLYDIDGNGTLEVMGVEYLISYDLQGAGDLLRREGTGLNLNGKTSFYSSLYGANQVFQMNGNVFMFENPKVSFPSYLDYKSKNVQTRVSFPGSFPLYEQSFEREKVQFYGMPDVSNNKNLIRLMGRVRGCAPSSDKNNCGENAFDNEAKQWFN
jgi:hypothetical protein